MKSQATQTLNCVAQARGSRFLDAVAPQLLIWHLERRDKEVFLTIKGDNLEKLPSSAPAAKVGPVHNIKAVMERDK